MSKRLDPEIKALRALERAIRPLDEKTQRRVTAWLYAKARNIPWARE